MSNPWFRLYSEFATDPKIQMLGEADQRRFVMLLCLKCCNGDVTLQDTEVAFQLRISNEEWAQSKALFLQKGIIEDDNTPSAWDKRQFVSDSSAERVRRFRERHKQPQKKVRNVTVTPPDTESDTDTDTEESTTMAASLKRPKDNPQKDTALQTACRETWAAYSSAYATRYGTPPVRAARQNAQVKQIVQALGADEAPQVAAWFVRHPESWYASKCHDVGLLLADITKLRTEWATGKVSTNQKPQYLNGRDASRLAASRSIFGTDIEARHDDDRTIDAPATARQLGAQDIC